ncbi:MAG: nucleotidyl transferase AbiEii/AbiGii toxin family protein [Thermoplasmata archaeon]
MKFVCDKGDKRWVEIGGSNKMVTFKLWYESEFLKTTSFIKIQINFLEDIIYPSRDKETINLIEDQGQVEIESVFPEDYEKYTAEVIIPSYDIREILCEKVRSILLRRGVKARDFLDIYKICDERDLELSRYTEEIVRKTNFSLDLYRKYRKNLDDKKLILSNKDLFSWGDEREFVLTDIDEEHLYGSVDKINTLLIDVVNNL